MRFEEKKQRWPIVYLLSWAVLSDEQMSKGWPFSLLNDEQMSNWVGVKHQPVICFRFVYSVIFYGFYYGKSPLNHHLGNMCVFFQPP